MRAARGLLNEEPASAAADARKPNPPRVTEVGRKASMEGGLHRNRRGHEGEDERAQLGMYGNRWWVRRPFPLKATSRQKCNRNHQNLCKLTKAPMRRGAAGALPLPLAAVLLHVARGTGPGPGAGPGSGPGPGPAPGPSAAPQPSPSPSLPPASPGAGYWPIVTVTLRSPPGSSGCGRRRRQGHE